MKQHTSNLMKTLSLSPPIIYQPRPPHNIVRFHRNSNSISLDSDALHLPKKAHGHPGGSQILYLKLKSQSQTNRTKADNTAILPPVFPSERQRYSEFSGYQPEFSDKIEAGSQPRKRDHIEGMFLPHATLRIYGRDSLQTGLKFFSLQHRHSKQDHSGFEQSLIGEQKTVYQKQFVRKNMRFHRKNVHNPKQNPAPSEQKAKEQPKKKEIKGIEPLGKRKRQKRPEQKPSYFTPWSTILENDID